MQGRRRLVLLAVIIVAVAIGAVGLTIVSLFEATLAETRDNLSLRVDELAAGARPSGHSASLVLVDGAWRVALGSELPSGLRASLPAQPVAPGRLQWLDGADRLAVMRAIDSEAVVLAWVPLADIRAPFQRAALYAALGIALMLALGLWLFYRMTAPLLHSIERSEARYRTLFANTAEGVLLIGDGIEECNARFCELFACRHEDVVGLPWREMFLRLQLGGPREIATLDALLETALRGGYTLFTWKVQQPGRPALVIEVAVRHLGEQTSRGPRVLVSLRDVTAREEAARELRKTEQALQESREKLAEAANSSTLVELAAGIAHEVNQPLAAIANYACASQRMIATGKPPSEVACALDRIAEQAQRAGDAIQRIRALVDSGRGRGADHACINRLVREVLELMDGEIRRHGARVEVETGEDVPVHADPAQIQQVVVQLLRNALEAGAGVDGEHLVRIVTRRKGDSVEVDVEDRGCGLAPEPQARMFEPFFTTKEGAMGMGLPISVSIIRSHRGELEVDPACERGTRIRFRLPVDARAASRQPSAEQVSAGA